MNFTSSPFERMMKEKPRPQAPAENRPPRGSACYGCCYWRGLRPAGARVCVLLQGAFEGRGWREVMDCPVN